MGGFLTALIFAVSPDPSAIINGVSTADVVYKHPLEIWLDVLRDEYERDVARSPLERGVLLADTRTLDTCFTVSGGGVSVLNSNASATPLAPLGLNPAVVDIGGVKSGALDANRDVRAQGIEVVTRWKALEQQLGTLLDNQRSFPPPRPDDPRLVEVLVARWSKLAANGPDNLDVNAAAAALGLTAEHKKVLKAAGATDLRSLAHALRAAPTIESYNTGIQLRKKADKTLKSLATPIAAGLSAAQSDEIRGAMAKALAKSLGGAR